MVKSGTIITLNKTSETLYNGLQSHQHKANNQWFATMHSILNIGGIQANNVCSLKKTATGWEVV